MRAQSRLGIFSVLKAPPERVQERAVGVAAADFHESDSQKMVSDSEALRRRANQCFQGEL
jgi:hypothetical protein